jgi:DnaJ-class molecular chaperone
VASKTNNKQADENEQAEETPGPQECMPCRGSGQVTSNLGGSPSSVACPWCEGSGKRLPAVDAQQTWLAQAGEDDGTAASADEAA